MELLSQAGINVTINNNDNRQVTVTNYNTDRLEALLPPDQRPSIQRIEDDASSPGDGADDSGD